MSVATRSVNTKDGKGPKTRTAFWVVLMVFVAVAFYFRSISEPTFDGQPLSEWLPNAYNTPLSDRAKETIRKNGPKCIPFLVRQIKAPPSETSLRSRLRDWLADHPSIPIQFARESDRTEEVVLAFKVLGPLGKPAIKKLSRMLGSEDPHISETAARCLAAIGPDAIPALTNLLSGNVFIARTEALVSLAGMGPAASATEPLVGACIHETNQFIANDAIRTLGEMTDAGEKYSPKFEMMLMDTNNDGSAAFALTRLGPGHFGVILDALTNNEAGIKDNLMAAVELRACEIKSGRLEYFEALRQFQGNVSEASLYLHTAVPKRTPFLEAWWIDALMAIFDRSDAKVRAKIAALLGDIGLAAFRAVPALTEALKDSDEGVRNSASNALAKIDVEVREGGIIRGPKSEKRISLVFTGHTFAEGGETILNELARHKAKASFFLTGDFLANPKFKSLVERIVKEGHYLGPHSDKHLLYCPWTGPKETLVSRDAFEQDLRENIFKIQNIQIPALQTLGPRHAEAPGFWLPAYEWYNQEIVDWSREGGLVLVNYTPGTRSNADYTEDGASNFVSSKAIMESILKKEREDAHGLNGFLLLMHIGVGPGRKDKMCDHLGELLDELGSKGYQFVRVDELLRPIGSKAEKTAR